MSDDFDELLRRMGATPSTWSLPPSTMPPLPRLLDTLDRDEIERRKAAYEQAMAEWRAAEDEAARARGWLDPLPARLPHEVDGDTD